MDTQETLAAHIAKFVTGTRHADIPSDVLRSARKALLDSIGVAVAGAQAEGSTIVQKYVTGLAGCCGPATVFGTALRTEPRYAALANGMALCVDDYDDVFHPSRLHPSGPVLAAVFAQAEHDGAHGRDVLAAFAVGTEVTCKISLAIDPLHYQRGYHATSTCGVFGATAGVCSLRGLPVQETLTALGIAGSDAAGLRENFGTMVKPLHSGRAAENAVVASALAGLGFTSAATILEGPRGFFMAGGGGYDRNMPGLNLGNPWSYVAPGVSIRPFPSGNLTHPAMCTLLDLVQAHDIAPGNVQRLVVRTHRLLPVNLTYHRPVTALQGKLSMEFCLAVILVLKAAGLNEFTDAIVSRPDVQEMMDRIELETYSDAEAQAQGYSLLTTFLDLELKDGCRIPARADVAKGSFANPMSEAEVAHKFRECAAFAGWTAKRAEKTIELIAGLDELDDINALTAMLGAVAQ